MYMHMHMHMHMHMSMRMYNGMHGHGHVHVMSMPCCACPYSRAALRARSQLHHDSEIDELFKIFQLLGTPSTETWAGVKDLPDWNPRFPTWARHELSATYGALGPAGVELLERLLIYDPMHRIVGKEALAHVYFESFDADSIGSGPIA